MGKHSKTAEITQSPLIDEPIAKTRLDRKFLQRGQRATARKEDLVFGTEAADPFSGPNSPDSSANNAPRPNRRRRALAAVAIVAAAGGLAGGFAAFKSGGNAGSKAPVSISANMITPMEQAATKLGAYEKKQHAAAEVHQAVNDLANNAAANIIRMTAADPHVRQDPATADSGPDMYAWGGNYQHPESEVSQYGDHLTVSTIDQPGGENAQRWDGVKVIYKIPSSMMGEFSHPMTATDWEQIKLGSLQFESMNVEDSTLANSSEGVTLSAAHGGFQLGSEQIAQTNQLTHFGQSAVQTLERLHANQAEFN